MSLDGEMDRALREERTLQPSPGFTEDVMRAVRRTACEAHGIGFPWTWLAWGLASCAALTAAGVALAARIGTSAPVGDAVAQWARNPSVVATVVWLPATLAACYALVVLSLRVAGREG